MKIKKLLPEELQDKSLGIKVLRKLLKPTLKKMEGECNSPETATDFLIKTDYTFGDMPGKKMAALILGDQKGAWLKLAKDEIKKDKKFTLIGKCYIKSEGEEQKTLVLLAKKGAAKKNLVKRQLEKFALKGLPYTVQLGEILDEPVDETEEPVEEQLKENLVAKKEKMYQHMANMDAQIAKLKAQLKIV